MASTRALGTPLLLTTAILSQHQGASDRVAATTAALAIREVSRDERKTF